MKLTFISFFLLFLLIGGCSPNTENDLAIVPNAWISERVEKAKIKFDSNEAGKIVWRAMEAHGGLEKYYQNGPLSFHFNYRPLDGSTPRDSYQVVDTWRSKAKHRDAMDSTSQFGWDGANAWEKTSKEEGFAYNTRFWALTPFFFMGQPFVLDGDGVNLELLERKIFNGESYDPIKVTFDPNTGDAPDDYYILYFHPESHQLAVIRYIVSYPGYFEKGKHMPEKFMTLEGIQEVDGIIFPKRYKTHWLAENDQPGEYITSIELSEISFLPELRKSDFAMPEGAKLIEGY